MKVCVTNGVIFPSPPLPKSIRGKIFHKIGKYAEEKIGADFQTFTGRRQWYPVPIDAPDFRDGSQGLNSKTLYYSFLVEKNPDVDKQKLEWLMNSREAKGEDGQIVYIPDFMGDKAPVNKRFYEVKPGMPNRTNEDGETKIASVDGLMADTELPYKPGENWQPVGRHELFNGYIPMMAPGLLPIPIPVKVIVTLEYKRHDWTQGLVVYHFCIDANFSDAIKLAVILALLALIIILVLFPELLPEIPLPDIPIPRIPELPAPRPSPFPVPPPQQPVPIPVPGRPFGISPTSLRKLIADVPGERTEGLRQKAMSGSVGKGGRNVPDDVQAVQLLLNSWQILAGQPCLRIDGIAGPLTCGAITALQGHAGLKVVDGRADPGGPTLDVLTKLGLVVVGATVRNASRRIHVPQTGGSVPTSILPSVFWAALSGAKDP